MFVSILLLGTTMATFTEKAVADMTFPGNLNNVKLTGVSNEDGHLGFWNSSGSPSQLTFDKTNPENEWSFEFEINVPHLRYPQTSSIHAWYTDKLVDGVIPKDDFHGFVAGLEFVGRSVEVFVAVRENSNEKVVRDYFEFGLIEDLEKIRIKVIHTSKNMKVEIYNDKDIIYDHLRLLDQKYFGVHTAGGHLTLIAHYVQVDKSDAFKVSLMSLNKRQETDKYDPHRVEVLFVEGHDADKQELRSVVADFEHFMKYIEMVFGDPQGSTMTRSVVGAKTDMSKLGKVLAQLDTLIRSRQNLNTQELHNTLERLEVEIRNLQKEMMGMQVYSLKAQAYASKSNKSVYIVVALLLAGFFGWGMRDVKIRRSVDEKKSS